MPSDPLVSCIMPTADRPANAREAIWYFQQQSYGNRELVVLDNGSAPILVPRDERIRYVRCAKAKIGALRNRACELARGEYICHWDDDDLYHRSRIGRQLLVAQSTGSAVVGFNRMRFVDIHDGSMWEYPGSNMMAIGVSLFYRREFWQANKFDERVSVDEERGFFLAAMRAGNLYVEDAGNLIIATIHGTNTSPRQLRVKPWRRVA